MQARAKVKFNNNAIRNWSLYAIRKSDGKYYVGLTSYSDARKRIRQHGGRKGAYINRGLKVEEVLEIRKIGKMPAWRAQALENDMTIEYMKKFGQEQVRGGRMIRKGRLFFREYNPGTNQAIVQTLLLMVGVLIIVFICLYMLLNN